MCALKSHRRKSLKLVTESSVACARSNRLASGGRHGFAARRQEGLGPRAPAIRRRRATSVRLRAVPRIVDGRSGLRGAAARIAAGRCVDFPKGTSRPAYLLRLAKPLPARADTRGAHAQGGWNEGESAEQAAQREAWEEAGVRGDVLADLGEAMATSSKGNVSRMRFFLLHTSSEEQEYDEAHRNKKWVSDSMRRCRTQRYTPPLAQPVARGVLSCWKSKTRAVVP